MDAKQLKDSILQYAMQGKLVPQDPNDEPAIELLKQIKIEKEQLIAQKVIKKEKVLPEISEEEIPFEIPETWEWCRIKDVYFNIGQKKPDAKFTYIDVAAIDNKNGVLKEELSEIESANAPSRARKVLTKGDVIFATVRPYLKNIAVIDREVANELIASTAFVVMTPIQIEADFLYHVLISPMFDTQVASKVQGVTYPAINDANFNNLVIPVPPKNEQKRIVEQIKKLQSIVSAYGEKQERLNQIQNEFPVKLEKSILQYAMQGKLVEQDSINEPASKLIERIKLEKEELIKNKVIKKEKAFPDISEEEIPFDIPETWEWVRLGDIAIYIQRGKSPKYSDIEKVPVISQKCIQWKGFNLAAARFIDPDTMDKYDSVRFVRDGDLLWNSTGLGTVGRINRYSSDGIDYETVVVDSHVTIVRLMDSIDSEFILRYLASPIIQHSIEDICSGSTKQKELNTGTIKNIVVPVPPINEQKAIVAEVSKLLSIKDAVINLV
ncbi:restriction endonuclease subunit S [Bacillus cereus]|nr:restriction endonuclease subunit S [Bacillus cereus]